MTRKAVKRWITGTVDEPSKTGSDEIQQMSLSGRMTEDISWATPNRRRRAPLKDDAQRPKCFDGVITDKAGDQPTTEAEITWEITESKSPIDDSPQVTSSLHALAIPVARGEPAHRSASALPQAVHGVKNLMGSGATGRPLWARYEIRSDQPAAICP
jgi:hypothetical protein